MKKVIKYILILTLTLFLVVVIGLFIYTSDSYDAQKSMNEEIELYDLSLLTVFEDFDQISYYVDDPNKNIVFIPGGKVNPESYRYLAVKLALTGYDVTIVKPLFNLAILTPNYSKRFLSNEKENVVVGHSLGGTVASLVATNHKNISEIVFLASYPIRDVSSQQVLMITAEFDLVLDKTKVEESKNYLGQSVQFYEIVGGNHAQFGWYGNQKKDGDASISTKTQQDLVVKAILDFIGNQ